MYHPLLHAGRHGHFGLVTGLLPWPPETVLGATSQPAGPAAPARPEGNANEVSENSAHDSKTLQQLLPKFHRQCRVVATQHFPALLWRHTGELPQEVVSRLVFGIAAPTDPERQQSRRRPDSYVPLLDHALR